MQRELESQWILKSLEEPCAEELMCHSKGYSGGRREITEYLIEALNQNLTPVVCEKGSVGACGDLSPMSQIALSLMGEGEMIVEGNIIDSKEALKCYRIKTSRT